ncbi:MAG: bifunctional 5,10-methylenetetrahydrofolate dehydrogenase/5,10-methenyltetrahydrofolate cyclohydrolase [Treponemataceae bacterium]
MSATIIDGQEIAKNIRTQLTQKANDFLKKNIQPCLAVILVGENPASISYVSAKQKALAETGIRDKTIKLPENIEEDALIDIIYQLNEDNLVHGILVQLPLPKHIDELKIISAICPQKDVDGFHPINIGKMMLGQPCFLPCTPSGIVKILTEMNILIEGKHAVIVGRSNIVGTPLSILLSRKNCNATVTLCHTKTKKLAYFTQSADILISAVGKPMTILPEMIKKNAVVIDVGVSRIVDESKKTGYRLCGDVDFEGVSKIASFITPVPKGVGPMTITMLISNVLQACENIK